MSIFSGSKNSQTLCSSATSTYMAPFQQYVIYTMYLLNFYFYAMYIYIFLYLSIKYILYIYMKFHIDIGFPSKIG